MSWHGGEGPLGGGGPTQWEDPHRGSSERRPPAREAHIGGFHTDGHENYVQPSPGQGLDELRTDPRSVASGVDQVEAATPVVDAPASPPILWLAAAAACVLTSLAVFTTTNGATMGLVGWLVGGPAAIGAWGIFLVADKSRRLSGWYRPSVVADWMRRAVIALALVAVALNAFHVANDVARGTWT